MVGQQNY